ncbi:MAG: class I SAM-dependent methyltransferase [Alphaproteobacteria bacterium]|nr:class I SAM-dependent methyltransferase [Alphaproteobacteria bacterium]
MSVSWYESDATWNALQHRFDSPEAWGRATAEAEAILELLDLPEAARICDLASGTGRLAIELARRGHEVTAVERHPAFANRIAKMAGRAEVKVEIVRRDMLGFERAGAFDAMVLWDDSLGYFDNAADDRAFLARCARSLKPDGKMILGITPKEQADRAWPIRTWSPLAGDRLLLEENLIVRNFAAIRHTWILVEGSDRRTFHGSRRLYSASELADALYAAGFGEVECYGGLDGSAFGRRSSTLVAVATR